MTIQEFNEHNKNYDMPKDWIGQGWGYKSEWDISKPDDIIYIPEYAYEWEDEHVIAEREKAYFANDFRVTVKREKAYSVNDFIKIANGDTEKAKKVFNNADWQFPESIPDEPWFEDDDEEEFSIDRLKLGDTVLIRCKVEDISNNGTVTVSTINYPTRKIYIDADEIVRKE